MNNPDPVALAREMLKAEGYPMFINPTDVMVLAKSVIDQDARLEHARLNWYEPLIKQDARIKELEHDCDEASDDLVLGLRKRIKELESFTADYKLDQPWRGVIAIMSKHIKELETDGARVDWMEQFIETGVIETAFELDGGIHLTLSAVGDKKEVAFREQNSLREAIDKARAALAGKPREQS